MSAQGMRLKALLKNYAARCGVPAQVACSSRIYDVQFTIYDLGSMRAMRRGAGQFGGYRLIGC